MGTGRGILVISRAPPPPARLALSLPHLPISKPTEFPACDCDSSPLASSSSPRGSPERNRKQGRLIRVAEAMEHKETGCQAPEGPILCVNNCGFFGSAATMNMCSKCHKEMIMKQEQAKLAASSIDSIVNGTDVVMEPVVAAGNTAVAVAPVELQTMNVQPADVAGPSEGAAAISKGKVGPNRCSTCRKRVGLTGFNCRCGNLYCALHRYSDKHDCKFDYRTAARDAIAKANPVVKADKLDKI